MVTKLLVVDGDLNQLERVRLELEDEGYEVLTARDGDDAARLLSDSGIDLIVLDLMLDGVAAGADILVRIAQRYPSLPVVVHTANANLQHGLIDYLTEAFVIKGPDLTTLKQEVRRALGKGVLASIHAACPL